MKRIFGLILVLVLVLSVPAVAAVDFDPSQYTEEELREIQQLVRDALMEHNSFTGDEIVIYEDNGVIVYTTGWEYDADYAELTLDVILVNHSGGKVALTVEEVYLNDWAVYMGGWIEADNDKKARDDCYCYTDEDAGITSMDELEVLEFVLEFCDPESYDTLFTSDVITLYF